MREKNIELCHKTNRVLDSTPYHILYMLLHQDLSKGHGNGLRKGLLKRHHKVERRLGKRVNTFIDRKTIKRELE